MGEAHPSKKQLKRWTGFWGLDTVLIYSIGVFIFMLPLIPIGYLSSRLNKFLLYTVGFILAVPVLVFNLYFWGLWAAYCVSLTYSYSGEVGVVYKCLYWVTGFLGTVVLIGWLESQERRSVENTSEVKRISRSSLVWKIILIVFFFVFALVPNLMNLPYGIVLERVIPSVEISTNVGNDSNSDDLLNEGLSKLNSRQYTDSINIFSKIIDNDPSNIEALIGRASAKIFLRDFEGAIYDCDKAIELNPNLEQIYFLRGNSKNLSGYSNQAIEDYSKAIEINPNFAIAFEGRGTAKLWSMDLQGAIKDFDKAIELNINHPESYSGRGTANLLLGFNKKALLDCDKAIEMYPNYAEAYSCRGLSKIKLGQTNDGCLDLYKSKEMGYSQAEKLIKSQCKE